MNEWLVIVLVIMLLTMVITGWALQKALDMCFDLQKRVDRLERESAHFIRCISTQQQWNEATRRAFNTHAASHEGKVQ